MNKRIRELRKFFKEKQDEFGKKIGISSNYVSLIETGERNPSEIVIKAICNTYGVSYEWLVHGIGEMIEDTDFSAMAAIDSIMASDNDFAKKVFKKMAQMSPEQWETLKTFIENLIK